MPPAAGTKNRAATTPRRTPGGVVKAAFGFVAMSVVAGVLVAVGTTPVIALTGVGASSGISLFQNLPSYLEIGTLMQKTNILAGDPSSPTLLASFYDQNRVEVGWDQVAQSAKDAAIAGEDPRFYDHGGVDLQGTLRAIASTYVLGSDTQGGSSITQQYVKNVLVQKAETIADATERAAAYEEATATTPERKVKEMRLAIGLEKEYTKDEILLGYLNIALFGGTVYGIEAAANYYYGIPSSALSTAQSASLLAIVNNPEKFRFDQPDDAENGAANGYAATKERRDYILDRMLEYEKITQEEHDAAVAEPITPNITQPSTGCQTAGNAAYFCDYVTYVLRNDPAFGATDDERFAAVKRGGYDIYTSLDLDIQSVAQESLDASIPQTDPRFDVGGAAVSVEAGTGRVLAMVQNKTYSQDPAVLATGAQYSAINLNVDADYGGGDGFQVGSTYKVFTLADWLSDGRTLNESFDSRTAGWPSFPATCQTDGTLYYPGNYAPGNDSASENASSMTALQATTNSINTGFMGMAHELDLCDIRSTAESFGVHRADGDELTVGAASVLGTNEIAPLTMAAAYAGIANDGTTCTPIAIDVIVNSDGQYVAPPASTCTASVTADVAHGMQYAMQRVMTSGTGVASNPDDGIAHIGKTGTTDDAYDVWTAGASSKASLAVWVGSVTALDASGTKVSLRNVSLNGVQAAQTRHAVWKPIMTALDEKYGGDDFAAPPASMLASRSSNSTSAPTATPTPTAAPSAPATPEDDAPAPPTTAPTPVITAEPGLIAPGR